jgi:hypothetical protein
MDKSPSSGMLSSVSESWGGPRPPAANGESAFVELGRRCPMVTVIVRCDPVVRDPIVTPLWPTVPACMKHRHVLKV